MAAFSVVVLQAWCKGSCSFVVAGEGLPVGPLGRECAVESFDFAVRARMTTQSLAERTQIIQKATGWFVVAAGAPMLAVKETWELAEHWGWPIWGFLAALAVMAALATASNAAAIARHHASSGLGRSSGSQAQ